MKMNTKLMVIIMPESVTGYTQLFSYDRNTSVCTEKRCGVGKGCFTVVDTEYLTTEEWESRISDFQNMINRFKKDYPQYTFECIVE